MKGDELRERRIALDMTQEQLAAELEAASNTVARWERGERGIPPYLSLALETVERNRGKRKDTPRPARSKPKPAAKSKKSKPATAPKAKPAPRTRVR